MYTATRTRYPGAQPFADDDLSHKLFRGRERETVALTQQILSHPLVVLYARSGVGKTSLLNAGIAETLRAEGLLPLTVRVNDIALAQLPVDKSIFDRCGLLGDTNPLELLE